MKKRRASIPLGSEPGSRRVVQIGLEALDVHTAVLGTTRAGKSYLLQHLFVELSRLTDSNYHPQNAMIFIDPHGVSYKWLRRWAYTNNLDAQGRLLLIDLTEDEHIVGVNPMKTRANDTLEDLRARSFFVADSFLRVLSAEEIKEHGPLVREWMPRILFAMMANRLYLTEGPAFLSPGRSEFRRVVIDNIPDEEERSLWAYVLKLDDRADSGREQAMRDLDMMLGSTRRRLETYLKHPTMRRILGSPASVDWGEVIEQRKIVLVNLGPARNLEPSDRRLLGMQIIEGLRDEVMWREKENKEIVPTYLFLDECHHFVCDALSQALAETGKFGLKLVLAFQYLEQLIGPNGEKDVLTAVLQLCKTKFAYRLDDPSTADYLARVLFDPWIDTKKVKQVRWQQLTQVVNTVIQTENWSTSEADISNWARVMGTAFGTGSSNSLASPVDAEPGWLGGIPGAVASSSQQSSEVETRADVLGGGRVSTNTRGGSRTYAPFAMPGKPIPVYDYYEVPEQQFIASQVLRTLPDRHAVVLAGERDAQGIYRLTSPQTYETKALTEKEYTAIDEVGAQQLDKKLRQANPQLYLRAQEIDRLKVDRKQLLLEGPVEQADVVAFEPRADLINDEEVDRGQEKGDQEENAG